MYTGVAHNYLYVLVSFIEVNMSWLLFSREMLKFGNKTRHFQDEWDNKPFGVTLIYDCCHSKKECPVRMIININTHHIITDILRITSPHARQETVSLPLTIFPQVSSTSMSSHRGLSNIHWENSMILSLSFVVGSQPRLLRSSPDMAYLTMTSQTRQWQYIECTSDRGLVLNCGSPPWCSSRACQQHQQSFSPAEGYQSPRVQPG